MQELGCLIKITELLNTIRDCVKQVPLILITDITDVLLVGKPLKC